jgi:hypothetical protein
MAVFGGCAMAAAKAEDTSWKVPQGPSGPELKARLDQARAAKPSANPWLLHVHTSLSPIIEVAADGKTALGVWDSFGPAINSADSTGWE